MIFRDYIAYCYFVDLVLAFMVCECGVYTPIGDDGSECKNKTEIALSIAHRVKNSIKTKIIGFVVIYTIALLTYSFLRSNLGWWDFVLFKYLWN